MLPSRWCVSYTDNVIYEATVTTTTGDTKTYIGMTEHEFKTRYNMQPQTLFQRPKAFAQHSTFKIHLGLERQQHRLSNQLAHHQEGKCNCKCNCNLCLSEKLCILSARDISLLNKKSELVTKCHHKNKFFATTNQNRRRSNRS